MKLVTAALSAAAVSFLCASALAAEFNFSADLSGNNEVPPSGSGATGTAALVYDDVANTLSVDWDIMDLEGAPASPGSHIHNAPPGANGPVVFPFHNPDGTWPLMGSALWSDVPANMVDALFAGELYLNFHTDTFQPGELRGQIIPAPTAVGLLGLAGVISGRRRR